MHRKILSLMLICIILCSNVVGVYADSNTRMSTYINLAAGKQVSSLNLTDLDLSQQDMRFLGVYISNFFVPFVTELGESDKESTVTQNKENIKKALQTNIKFSDELADSLTETLLGLSRASVQELVLCVSKEYQEDIVLLSGGDAEIPLNAYTATACMFGGLKSLVNEYSNINVSSTIHDSDKDIRNDVMKGVSDGDYQWGYFAYQVGDKYFPVFDFHISGKKATASSAAFMKCLEASDIKLGYGFSFFDFNADEASSKGEFETVGSSFSESQKYKMSIYGTNVAVDCFGNILFLGGNHQFVAVPGCMNPYTWIEVNDDGEDVGKGIGGSVYNLINIQSMSLLESDSDNKLFYKYDDKYYERVYYKDRVDAEGNKVPKKLIKGNVETKVIRETLSDVKKDKTSYKLRISRGSDKNDFTTGFVDSLKSFFGSPTSFVEVAMSAQAGFKKANPKAYNYFNAPVGINTSTSHITLPGKELPETRFYKNTKDSETGKVTGSSKIYVYDSFVYIDSLGDAHFNDDKGELVDFSTFNVIPYKDASKVKTSMASWSKSDKNGFTNIYKNLKDGSMVIPSSTVCKEAMIGIYVTYAYASLFESVTDTKMGPAAIGYRINSDSLPNIPDEPIDLSSSISDKVIEDAIRDWTYYLLHPTEGLDYFRVWANNKISSLLLGWHDDMVGTNGTASVNGTTKYRGFSGYVTTPELHDVPWVSSMLNTFNNLLPFLLVIMMLFMLVAYIVGVLSLQKAVIGFIIFAICISLPVPAINATVGTANRFSSSLYGEKFTYWALVQHESYSSEIDKAAESGDYSNYLRTLYANNSAISGNQGGESVMLKWQAPKKMASLMLTKEDKKALGGTSSLLTGLINSTYSGESYLDDPDSVYLYRSYIDIANFSRYIHRGLVKGIQGSQPVVANANKEGWSKGLKDAVGSMNGKANTAYEADRSSGYANYNKGGSKDLGKKILRVTVPLNSKLVNEQLKEKGSVKDLDYGEYVGINQDAFQFAIPMFNVKTLNFQDQLKTKNFDAKSYSEEDFTSLASFGLMSESVFYYFSWYLYETGLEEETYVTSGYKHLLLGEDNAGFFYNTKGNGELKDFMDMKSLFTYIIPYLKECNELVWEWDDVYGIKLYEGVPTEEGHANDASIKNNPELKQKYWHNLNVARLYNMYTPWVDVMYDCSYAKAETIKHMGEKYLIEDPINPASYPADEGRPMVFSRSEMHDYGLEEKDLTKVERLILKCEDGMQERMFNLLNYHTFNDVVLNTASAINCAFEFNETFSENSLMGANHNIYPQSFELNDFSYDAFLRFILSNSTGDSMVVDEGESFYQNMVNNSSLTSVIVMLILDIIAMYIVPGCKLFFIVGIFVLAILMILMSALRVDTEQKFIKKLISSFVKPILQFLAVTCGMALIVSWFMGEGNNAVTGSMQTSIALGEPVSVMLLMIVLNCAVVYLYVKILMGIWKDIKNSGAIVGNFMGGVIGSLGGVVSKSLASATSKGVSMATGGASGSKGAKGGSPEGKASPRAIERGSNRSKEDEQERRRNRDVGRFNFKNAPTKKSEVRDSKEIDDKVDAGYKNIKTGSKNRFKKSDN